MTNTALDWAHAGEGTSFLSLRRSNGTSKLTAVPKRTSRPSASRGKAQSVRRVRHARSVDDDGFLDDATHRQDEGGVYVQKRGEDEESDDECSDATDEDDDSNYGERLARMRLQSVQKLRSAWEGIIMRYEQQHNPVHPVLEAAASRTAASRTAASRTSTPPVTVSASAAAHTPMKSAAAAIAKATADSTLQPYKRDALAIISQLTRDQREVIFKFVLEERERVARTCDDESTPAAMIGVPVTTASSPFSFGEEADGCDGDDDIIDFSKPDWELTLLNSQQPDELRTQRQEVSSGSISTPQARQQSNSAILGKRARASLSKTDSSDAEPSSGHDDDDEDFAVIVPPVGHFVPSQSRSANERQRTRRLAPSPAPKPKTKQHTITSFMKGTKGATRTRTSPSSTPVGANLTPLCQGAGYCRKSFCLTCGCVSSISSSLRHDATAKGPYS